MKNVKLKDLLRSPLRKRYLLAGQDQRLALESVVADERAAVVAMMSERGYRLEAVVGDVYGVFTRGSAVGTMRVVSEDRPARRHG